MKHALKTHDRDENTRKLFEIYEEKHGSAKNSMETAMNNEVMCKT